MAAGEIVPPEDEATRWIKPRLLGKDDDGQIIVDERGRPTMVFPAAYALADDEDGLSITWLQFFGVERLVHLPRAAEAFRVSIPSQNLKPKSAFAIAQIATILAVGKDHGAKLRIIQDPIDGNKGHSEIRRDPREISLLQSVLAEQVFSERYLYGDIRRDGWVP